MRWKVETENKTYIIAATSSKDAVESVRKKDQSNIKKASLMQKNTVDKIKTTWRKWFGK